MGRRTSLLIIAALGAGLVAAGVLLTVSLVNRSESPERGRSESMASDATDLAHREGGRREGRAGPGERELRHATRVSDDDLPRAPAAELEALIPDEHGRAEIQRGDFESLGGIESPGADPERGRREIDEPGWADSFESELRQGLSETVLVGGEELAGVECERGRCLVELKYEDMRIGLERVGALRQWLTERVPCRAYTEGPVEGDSPSAVPEQQIWILCGEPSESPYR